VRTVRVGVVEDTLLAEHRVKPMIIVMPFGSTGTFTDKAWANGTQPNEQWATFLWRDVVRAIDARFRTIPDGAGRALGGLSEGGYASLNIGLRHPREFRLLESWSGYEKADDIRSIFGGKPALLKANSPLLTVSSVAPTLRRDHDYIWFYSGEKDSLKPVTSLVFVPVLLACHGLGFVALQLGFQRGRALATAGLATLLTNALPIVAGTTLYGEGLGSLPALRLAAFACTVLGATLLARPSTEERGRSRHVARWAEGSTI
jgi:hypothetical protein